MKKKSCFKDANGLKSHACAEKADGAAIAVTTKENAIKKTFGRRFGVPVEYSPRKMQSKRLLVKDLEYLCNTLLSILYIVMFLKKFYCNT